MEEEKNDGEERMLELIRGHTTLSKNPRIVVWDVGIFEVINSDHFDVKTRWDKEDDVLNIREIENGIWE